MCGRLRACTCRKIRCLVQILDLNNQLQMTRYMRTISLTRLTAALCSLANSGIDALVDRGSDSRIQRPHAPAQPVCSQQLRHSSCGDGHGCPARRYTFGNHLYHRQSGDRAQHSDQKSAEQQEPHHSPDCRQPNQAKYLLSVERQQR